MYRGEALALTDASPRRFHPPRNHQVFLEISGTNLTFAKMCCDQTALKNKYLSSKGGGKR